MPRNYKHKLGGYQYNFNVEQQEAAYKASIDLIQKYKDNRRIIYDALGLIKGLLRKYPNLEAARIAADEISELQTQLFKEADLTNDALAIINQAIIALNENEQIVQESLEVTVTPPYMDQDFITNIVTRVLIDFSNQSESDQE